MPLGIMPGEWDWMQRQGGIFGLPGTAAMPPASQSTVQGGIFGRLANRVNEGIGKMQTDPTAQLGLRMLANSGPAPQKRGLGEIFGTSALQSQEAQQGLQDNQLRQKYIEAQIEAMRNKRGQNPFGEISPRDYTPESVSEFQRTGDYGVLKPKGSGQNIGNFNPGDYTPQSFARFMQTGDPSDLKRYVTPANPSVHIIGGVPTIVQPNRAGGAAAQAQLSDLAREVAAKAQLAAAESGARTTAATQAEYDANSPKRDEQARQIMATVDSTVGEIDKALNKIDWTTTGLVGSISKALPGTDAFDLGQTLLTVKANIGFDRLQQMRDASPTGGALGQVAVQELTALQATIASLEQAQSGKQLKTGLEKVKTHYNRWRDAVIESRGQRPALSRNGLDGLTIYPKGQPETAAPRSPPGNATHVFDPATGRIVPRVQ